MNDHLTAVWFFLLATVAALSLVGGGQRAAQPVGCRGLCELWERRRALVPCQLPPHLLPPPCLAPSLQIPILIGDAFQGPHLLNWIFSYIVPVLLCAAGWRYSKVRTRVCLGTLTQTGSRRGEFA
jgi:hypothetical protein